MWINPAHLNSPFLAVRWAEGRSERYIPGGTEHEGWFPEDTEVIDFFAPPRDDFLVGGKPAYISEG
jgi:hypothetical protein